MSGFIHRKLDEIIDALTKIKAMLEARPCALARMAEDSEKLKKERTKT